MPRVSGIDIPLNKRTDIALTFIYGIGRKNVVGILKAANVSGEKRAKDLTREEIARLQKVIDSFKVEGDLRAQVYADIKRLKEIGSYRGLRHIRNLPVRGQRTRSNARTKRGKRVTIGALRKEMAEKMGLIKKEVPGQESKETTKKGS